MGKKRGPTISTSSIYLFDEADALGYPFPQNKADLYFKLYTVSLIVRILAFKFLFKIHCLV